MGQVFQAVAGALTPQNSYNANTNGIQNQQQELASALLAQSQGQGPNPAQQQFQQNTNQAIQQNAGMIASQKGINPALAARMAGQNAANMTQQSAGNAATLQAQQQLNSQQQLAGVYGNIAQEQLGTQGINAGVAGQNTAGMQNTVGGLLQGGSAAAMSFLADGGQVQNYDDGGTIQQMSNQMLQSAGVPVYAAGNANFGQNFGQIGKMFGQKMAGNKANSDFMGAASGSAGEDKALDAMWANPFAEGGPVLPPHLAEVHEIYHGGKMAKGGQVNAMVSPGESYIPPEKVPAVAKGKESVEKAGKKIPGKAEVKGDSLKNDKVPAKLESGGMVIPRSVMNSEDPAEAAKNFVANELSKKQKSKASPDDFKSAIKSSIDNRRVK